MEKKNLVWKIIVGVILGIILFFVLFIHFKDNPMQVYKTVINSFYTKLDSNLENMENFKVSQELEPVKINSRFKFNTNLESLEEYNNLEFNYTSYIDYQKNESLVELVINKDEYLIKTILALLEGNTYFKNDELFDKTILIKGNEILDNNGIELNRNDLDTEELRYILKSFKDITINSLDKSNFKVIDERVDIKGKNYNTKKYIYILDDENQRRTASFIIENILDDTELLEYISNLFGNTTEEMEKLLNDSLDNIESNERELETINVYIYMYKDKAISFRLEEDEVNIIYNNIDDFFEFIIEKSDTEMKIYKDDEDIKFYIKENDVELFNGYISYTEDTFKINVIIANDVIPINLSLSIENITKEDNQTLFDISLETKMNVLGNNYNFSLDGDFAMSECEDLPSFDLSNVQDINTLTNEDIESITLKFNEILTKLGMNSLINQE